MNRPNTRRGFGPFPVTAYSITRVGLCHVSGAHLSEAPNETFAQIEEQEQEAARLIVRGEWEFRDRKTDQALADQMDAAGREAWRHA